MKTTVDYDALVKRLRETCQTLRRSPMAIADTILFFQEAANAIEQLRRERGALQEFKDNHYGDAYGNADWVEMAYRERDAALKRVGELESFLKNKDMLLDELKKLNDRLEANVELRTRCEALEAEVLKWKRECQSLETLVGISGDAIAARDGCRYPMSGGARCKAYPNCVCGPDAAREVPK